MRICGPIVSAPQRVVRAPLDRARFAWKSAVVEPAAAHDEMVDGRGKLRAPWRGLIGAFAALGDGGLAERAHRLDRAFEEEGVASVLPGAFARAWRCDPVPLPLAAAEFAELAAGLAQRARVLEAFLADLYGPRAMLAEGLLPPSLAFANPGFLRIAPLAGQGRLQLYAADLVRGPDGAWRVLADRTAAPAGLGQARENRRLLGRVMPEAFHPVQVRPLRPFFDLWQDALRELAPPGTANPSVAVLTPGTASPLWFEHMYLARELSCALVESGDLAVSGGGVFLKSLRGLARIDVLLRRIDGRMIDPLELEAGSLIGTAGLIDAARAGSVRITNDPGSGAAEAPALAAFLPALARRFFGETLRLPGVPTLWLGEAQARALVASAPEAWLLRPATDGAAAAQAPASMPPAERDALLARIEAEPWAWAATRALPPSLVPCVTAEGLQPRPVVLRLFLVRAQGHWQAMPGGLARVLDPAEALASSLPTVGLAKDVWVLTEDRGDIVGPAAAPATRLAIRRPTGDLPSRAADNLFWLGRTVERLERAARLGRAALARLSRGTFVLPHEGVELGVLLRCLVEAGVVAPEAATVSMLGEALRGAAQEGGALPRLFAEVARLTDSVRDRLTGDMYATFTQALRTAHAQAAAVRRSLDELAHALVAVLRFSTAVAGVAAENMVRGGGWIFLELGRRLERAHAIAVEIGFALDLPPPRIEAGLRLGLELCDSTITYRSRYFDVLQPAPVLDLVLADQGNPRGFAFQCAAMHGLLDELTGEAGGREALAGAVAGMLAEAEALVRRVAVAPDEAVAAAGSAAELVAIAGAVAALSGRITQRYFALLPLVRTVGLSTEPPALRGAA